jgi:hypothetical protein
MQHESEKLVNELPAWARAKEYGIDVAMLLDNIKRSPEERIRRHSLALATYKKLHNAANKKT